MRNMCDFINSYNGFYAMNTTKMRSANSAAIRLPECVLAPEIRLSPDRARSNQAADLKPFLASWGAFRGLKKFFPLSAVEKLWAEGAQLRLRVSEGG